MSRIDMPKVGVRPYDMKDLMSTKYFVQPDGNVSWGGIPLVQAPAPPNCTFYN